jgi:hypothetical protein
VIAVASVLGLVAAATFETSNPAPSPGLLAAVAAVTVTALLVTTLGSGVLALRLSPYKDLSAALRYPGATVIDTTWESSVRIDHIVSTGIRSVPGLSFAWGGAPPPQDGITFDGDDLSPVPLIGPGEAEFSSHVLNSVAFSLRPGGDVLILEPRGGLDVVVALAGGAGSVTAVEAHGPAVGAARRAGSAAYADTRVEVKIEEPRSFVERTGRRFDVIDVALTAPYRPVTSGAYSLAEDYMLTTEAFDAYLHLMRPGGVLTIMRWLQTPPSETVRHLYNVLPDDQYAELAARVLTDPEGLYRSYEFDIAPPTDDRPFFTHFFKWAQASQVLDTLGRTWQPFGGAGFFVLVALLVLSALGATVLVLGPLLVMTRRRRSDSSEGRLWTVGYFGLLGLGFLLVEIPLVQHYILLVGRPTTALAVVLFALLLAAGVGSVVSHRMPWRPTAVALALAAVAYLPMVRWMTALVLPAPPAIRMVVGAVALVPIGFLMGIMFPKGLARLERTAPHLIPWAWGINGTASVIAAAAAALLALTWGFQLVVTVGAACYGAVALLARDTVTEPLSLRRE